jgi:hypothetical protein
MTTGRINQVTIVLSPSLQKEKKLTYKPESLIVCFMTLKSTMISKSNHDVQAKQNDARKRSPISLFSHYCFLVQLCNLERRFDHRVLSES